MDFEFFGLLFLRLEKCPAHEQRIHPEKSPSVYQPQRPGKACGRWLIVGPAQRLTISRKLYQVSAVGKRWVTFQDESAARERGTSQGVRKEGRKTQSPFTLFGLILSNLNFAAFRPSINQT